jgi:hypothetical protein
MISIDDLLARNLLPDAAIRIGIRNLLSKKLREETRENAIAQSEALAAFVDELKRSPIAIKTAAANEQHYEVPTEFFKLVLGPRMKYSSGYWPREAPNSPTASTFSSSVAAGAASRFGWLRNILLRESPAYRIPRPKNSISKPKRRGVAWAMSASSRRT